MIIHFETSLSKCPYCSSKLKAYKTNRRIVKSAQEGVFTAIEHVKYCDNGHERKIYHSEALQRLVNPYCVFSNDLMIEMAKMRFIEGKSCNDIAKASSTAISVSEVNYLTNLALYIHSNIHEDKSPEISKVIGGYILQIDGTVDSNYDMIVAVRDSESGFVLYVRKCSAESYEEIKSVLETVKNRFGMPNGLISDMRAGIMRALDEVFPKIPRRICFFHFLKDLGKDLMEKRHIVLGKIINQQGIKSKLKNIFRELPEYDRPTLEELNFGYCTDKRKLAVICAKHVIGKILSIRESSGYGFPFSLRHLKFVDECVICKNKLSELNMIAESKLLNSAIELISKLTENEKIIKLAKELHDINDLFTKLREAMHVKDTKTPLSEDPIVKTEKMHEECNIVVEEMEVFMHTEISAHHFTAAKEIIDKYRKRETNLFAVGLNEAEIPYTNNGIERVFRKMRRNVRKRCGNIVTETMIASRGEQILLFQNLSIKKYEEIISDSEDLGALFGKMRMKLRKNSYKSIGKMKAGRLIEEVTKKLIEGTLADQPYTEELWDEALKEKHLLI